jgi:hypothetical protein
MQLILLSALIERERERERELESDERAYRRWQAMVVGGAGLRVGG